MTAQILKFPPKTLNRQSEDLLREAQEIYCRSVILMIEAVGLQMDILRELMR